MSMISFWRREFGPSASWDVHGAPSGDYRITARGLDGPSPKAPIENPRWMASCLSEIVHFATPHTVFALDVDVVQALLDIHAIVYPIAHHPPARELVLQRRRGEYLEALGDDLTDALSQGLLRLEKLEPLTAFFELGEEDAPPAQAHTAPEDTFIAMHLVDATDQPVPNRRYRLDLPDGSTREGRFASDGTFRFDDIAPGTARLKMVDQAIDGGRQIKEPASSSAHRVKQGDCLSSIAEQHGLYWKTVWDFSENEGLRKQRKSPNVLCPDDVVAIPEHYQKEFTLQTGKSHRLVAKQTRTSIKIRFNLNDTVLSNEPYRLYIDEDSATVIDGSTTKSGDIETSVPAMAKSVTIAFSKRNFARTFMLGQLDPVDTTMGLQARLRQLGYLRGPVDGKMGPLTAAALRGFQTSHKLPPSGEADAATLDKLGAAYGDAH
ncbi:peptidoglycan-binding protein [Pendulispora rubella]|uniref:Peptidoglycan-binding protein n=1 Tax=Pendulispora rubella TaxID=2741070 RepID=A0ABZ2KTV1_9BACT